MIMDTTQAGGSPAQSQDFAKLVDLQRQFSDESLALENVETKMSVAALDAAKTWGENYVVHQERIAQLDAEIKALFAKHPEWREGKSVKTPFGEVAQRTVTELEIPNPAMTVALIEARGQKDAGFKSDTFLRVEKEPNVEALEGLSDDELAKLGVSRVKSERISVKAAKVSAAKVVKAAAKKAEKGAA
jgi:hypothetical protein